jgi:thioredoxin-like negative regulator of GroEL
MAHTNANEAGKAELQHLSDLESLKDEECLLVKCYSTQCVRCPNVSALVKLMQESHLFTLRTCNIHNAESDLCEQLQVAKLPTLLLFQKGEMKARADGVWQDADVKSFINSHCPVNVLTDIDF